MENEIVKSEKVSPKHVFLHLFVIIMLYAATANFITLLFQYINYWITDPLAKTAYSQITHSSGLIRFSIASIVIVFPLFILTSWFLNKNYARLPAIREMRTRKWLIYFTLFVAALVITGDLVRIILTFLEGEMTLRFILKALVVLLVAGLIFYYYLRDLRQTEPLSRIRYFVWAVIALILITVVAGFFVIGSPKTERMRRFDYERVSHLQDIQWQVINYWQSKEVLPAGLANLTDDISGYAAPVDPENGATYEYNVTGPLSFELCAGFNLASDEENPGVLEAAPYPASVRENWKHEAGRTCFTRAIDAELYPPHPKNR